VGAPDRRARLHAYKLKKPVRYSYLDYSTLAARAENCAAEVRLNRRFAQGVYLGVVSLNLDPSGQLRLGGAGLTCDWLVKMVPSRGWSMKRSLDPLTAAVPHGGR
jgi:aminoglycoside phosphotransferase family enzyme